MRALFTRLKGASDPFQKVFHMEQGINRIVRRNKTKNKGRGEELRLMEGAAVQFKDRTRQLHKRAQKQDHNNAFKCPKQAAQQAGCRMQQR